MLSGDGNGFLLGWVHSVPGPGPGRQSCITNRLLRPKFNHNYMSLILYLSAALLLGSGADQEVAMVPPHFLVFDVSIIVFFFKFGLLILFFFYT